MGNIRLDPENPLGDNPSEGAACEGVCDGLSDWAP
jgi:hypothetical protein